MRLWVFSLVALLGSSLLSSAAASPVRVARPAPLVRSHTIPAQTNCPPNPGGSGILPDGDFSQAPEPTGGSDYGLFKGVVFAPDWIVTGPKSIDFYGLNAAWSAPNGVCSVDLDGTPGPGGMLHSAFPTKNGAVYTVTFLFSANGGGSPSVKTMLLRVGKDQFQTFTWDTSNGNDAQNGDWATETWEFTAHDRTSSLHLESKDPRGGNWGPVVAAISVTKN